MPKKPPPSTELTRTSPMIAAHASLNRALEQLDLTISRAKEPAVVKNLDPDELTDLKTTREVLDDIRVGWQAEMDRWTTP